jgi:3D-(3,5/4)-trihydroxycyclohexane-1,2-dione acylhydrolase (decyclizing)
MMASELVTAVQENIKITVILVQSHGFASIGALSQSVGSQRFGTAYRYRNPLIGAPDSQSWWDVPVAEVSELDSVNQARAVYDAARPRQRRYL